MRAAREKRGMSGRQLAGQIGYSHVTVSGWETGAKVPDPVQLGAYLGAAGIVGEEREQIESLAKNASDPNWLAPGLNEQLGPVLEYERTAGQIFNWEPFQVPGLLQTGDYARAVFSGSSRTPAELETAIVMRVGRAEVLTRPLPVDGVFVIGEAALRETIGDDQIMAHQFRHLLAMDERPNVTVRLLPFGRGWHPGLVGAFCLYRFAEQSPIVWSTTGRRPSPTRKGT